MNLSIFSRRSLRQKPTEVTEGSQLQLESLEDRMMLSTVSVYATGQTGQENMQVSVAGQTVATENGVSTSGEVVSFNTSGSLNLDDLRINFTNDQYVPGVSDRNLTIDKVVVDGQEYFADDNSVFSTGTWLSNDGIIPGYGRGNTLHSNGYFQFAGQSTNGSTIVVNASGDVGSEQFVLIAGSETFAAQTVSTSTRSYTFQTDAIVNAGSIRVQFINDQYDPANGIDSNLTVDSVVLDGTVYEAEDTSVFKSGVWDGTSLTSGYFQTETLQSNGYFQFSGGVQTGEIFSLDPSFGGGNGIATLTEGSPNGTDFTVAANGNIMMHVSDVRSGDNSNGTVYADELVLVSPDGTYVNSFGGNGIVDLEALVFPYLNGLDRFSILSIKDIEFDTQNRAIVIGTAFHGVGSPRATEDFLIRVNANGTLDTSFNRIGAVEPQLFGVERDQILVDGNDRVILANANRLTRLNANGQVDTSFGNNGYANLFDVPGFANPDLHGIQFDNDGSIIVMAGNTRFDSNVSAALYKFSANGNIVSSFGNNGRVAIPEGTYEPDASFLESFGDFAIDSQNRIVVGGKRLVYRFTSNGQFDNSFGDSGTSLLPENVIDDGFELVNNGIDHLAIDNQDRIVISYGDGLIGRLNVDGSADQSLSNDGFQKLTRSGIQAIEIDAVGRMLVGGNRGSDATIERWTLDSNSA